MNHLFEYKDSFALTKEIESNLIYGDPQKCNPEVCIMIPTYRRANGLELSLQSVFKQTGTVSYGIIVIDNDSSVDPDTDELMRKITIAHDNVLYYRNAENIGIAGNWNRCIELSRSDYLCILHDDDQLLPDYLNSLFPIASSVKFGAIGVFNRYFYFSGDGNHQGVNDKSKELISKLRGNKLIPFYPQDSITNRRPSPTACLYRKRACEEVGGFSFEKVKNGQLSDNVFFYRLGLQWPVFILPKILALRGVGDNDSFKVAYDVLAGDYYLNQAIIDEGKIRVKRLYRWFSKRTLEQILLSYNKTYGMKMTRSELCDRLGLKKKDLHSSELIMKLIQAVLWGGACLRPAPRN